MESETTDMVAIEDVDFGDSFVRWQVVTILIVYSKALIALALVTQYHVKLSSIVSLSFTIVFKTD